MADEQQTRPSAIVRELVGDETIDKCSTVELLFEAKDRAHTALCETPDPEAKREFALAKTLIEDAINRFNRGVYRAHGVFSITDAERLPLP